MCRTLSRGLVSPVLGGSGGLVSGVVSSIALVLVGVEGVAVGVGFGGSSSSCSSGAGSRIFISEVAGAFCSGAFGASASRRCGAGSIPFP